MRLRAMQKRVSGRDFVAALQGRVAMAGNILAARLLDLLADRILVRCVRQALRRRYRAFDRPCQRLVGRSGSPGCLSPLPRRPPPSLARRVRAASRTGRRRSVKKSLQAPARPAANAATHCLRGSPPRARSCRRVPRPPRVGRWPSGTLLRLHTATTGDDLHSAVRRGTPVCRLHQAGLRFPANGRVRRSRFLAQAAGGIPKNRRIHRTTSAS